MNLPLVSIMIITYNQIDFIHETLTSALEQDYTNLEVVVADDGSVDGTAEVIQEYAQKYPNRLVSLVGGPNLGITGNSNRGLRACKGKYIALQGGDDILLPGKITKQVEWMEADERRVLCGHDVENFHTDGGKCFLRSREMPLQRGQGAKAYVRDHIFLTTSVMIRADAIPSYGFDERLSYVSDNKLIVDCLANGGEFGYIDGVYARYRLHRNNITKKYQELLLDHLMRLALIEFSYPHLIRDCIRSRANLFNMYAYLYFLDGDILMARTFFVNSMILCPWASPKLYLKLALTFMPGVSLIYARYKQLRYGVDNV